MNQLNLWRECWNLPILPATYYPEPGGFIVDNMAAGFLYTTGTDMAFYEQFIVNPEIKDPDRGTAINLVDDAILAYAQEQKLKVIVGKTPNGSLLQRAISNGWECGKASMTVIYKIVGE